VADKAQLVRRALPQHLPHLNSRVLFVTATNWSTKQHNGRTKLIAICDELFPEMTRVLKDPNGPTALALRERLPTPAALATASQQLLLEIRGKAYAVSDAKLLELQQLALQSVGTKDLTRQHGLVLEQTQLIKELRLLQEHIERLENEIKIIVEQAREGLILGSLGLGPIQAATVIAYIGAIENFPNAGSLKSYFGWAPTIAQSGKTLDRAAQTHGGLRTIKQMMFLIVANAIRQDTEWARLYDHLVQTRCPYDERQSSGRPINLVES
jgi:transposase